MKRLKDRHREDSERNTEVRWRGDGSSAEKGKSLGLNTKRHCDRKRAEYDRSNVRVFLMQSLKNRHREGSEQETDVEKEWRWSL